MSFLLSFCIVLALIPQALSHVVCELNCTAEFRCQEDKSNQKMILTENEKVLGLCAANEFCDGDIRGVDCKCTSCPVGLTNCCRNTLPSCYCQPDQCKCQDTISTIKSTSTKPTTTKTAQVGRTTRTTTVGTTARTTTVVPSSRKTTAKAKTDLPNTAGPPRSTKAPVDADTTTPVINVGEIVVITIFATIFATLLIILIVIGFIRLFKFLRRRVILYRRVG